MRQGMLAVSVFLTGGLRAWLYFLLAGCVLEKKGSWEQRKILLGGAGAGAAAALFFFAADTRLWKDVPGSPFAWGLRSLSFGYGGKDEPLFWGIL